MTKRALPEIEAELRNIGLTHAIEVTMGHEGEGWQVEAYTRGRMDHTYMASLVMRPQWMGIRQIDLETNEVLWQISMEERGRT